jgi:hypothetical protein
MPPGIGWYPNDGQRPDPNSTPPNDGYGAGGGYGSVFFHILPFIEQDNLYKSSDHIPTVDDNYPFDFYNTTTTHGFNGYNCWNLRHQPVKIYRCPSDPTDNDGLGSDWNIAMTGYAYNHQIFDVREGGWGKRANFPAKFRDGTSNTIMFTEKYANPSSSTWNLNWGGNTWFEWSPKFAVDVTGPKSKFLVQPTVAWCDDSVNFIVPETGLNNNALQNPCQFMAVTPHTQAINVGLGDGSVRNVSANISGITWWSAVTPAGGEVLGSDW